MLNSVSFPKLGLSFTFPYYISIGSFHISFYGMIIAAGMLLALFYAYRNFPKVGVDSDKALDAILGGVIGGIVGARIYYVLFKWQEYKGNIGAIFDIRSGGLAIYGGIIGSMIVGLLIAKWRKIHISAFLDIVGVGFLIGQGIGRWGNFFNVEAFGSNTSLPWGMTGPKIVEYLSEQKQQLAALGVTIDPNMPVHPTFLYESIWCLIGALLLAKFIKHRHFDGEAFLLYIAYYGVERFFVEGLRTDSLMIGYIRVSQLLSALLIIAAILIWLVIRSKIKGSHDKNYKKIFVLTAEGQQILSAQQQKEKKKTVSESTEKQEDKTDGTTH